MRSENVELQNDNYIYECAGERIIIFLIFRVVSADFRSFYRLRVYYKFRAKKFVIVCFEVIAGYSAAMFLRL